MGKEEIWIKEALYVLRVMASVKGERAKVMIMGGEKGR